MSDIDRIANNLDIPATSKRIHGDTEPAFDSTTAARGSGPGSSTHLSTRDPHRAARRGRSTAGRRLSLTANASDAPNMAVVESNHIGSVAVKATAHALERQGTAEAQALGAVLFRAHEAARHLENLLELEAPDPRAGALMQDAKRIRKSIAVLLVDVALEAAEVPA